MGGLVLPTIAATGVTYSRNIASQNVDAVDVGSPSTFRSA
jgi:hypothetical protein